MVALLGVCAAGEHRIAVTALAPCGSLRAALDGKELSWRARLAVALGVARGAAYLHEVGRQASCSLFSMPACAMVPRVWPIGGYSAKACLRMSLTSTGMGAQGVHPPLVHRDLTSSNILLGADGRAMIAVRAGSLASAIPYSC